MTTRRTGRFLSFLTPLATALDAFVAAAPSAGAQDPCRNDDPFAVALRALADPESTELALTFTARTPSCHAPTMLEHLQVKTYAHDGQLVDVRNLTDVPAPDGAASIALPLVERGLRLAVKAWVKTAETVDAVRVDGETETLLRPDLAVARVLAPPQALSGRAFTLAAEVEELRGDVAICAVAVLSRIDNDVELDRVPLDVLPGGRVTAPFRATLQGSGPQGLRVEVVDASVREVSTANNLGAATVELTEFELNADRLILPSLVGYGGQFNPASSSGR